MKLTERERVVKTLRGIQDKTRKLKGNAYAGGEQDSLRNFKEVASRSGMTKYQVWAVYYLKHVMSVENAIADRPAAPVESSEGFLGRITDLTVYPELLACLLYEDGLLELPDEEGKADSPPSTL